MTLQASQNKAGEQQWPDLLQWAATSYGHHIALQTESRQFSFEQLDLLVSHCCARLSEQGLKPGDHVLLVADKSPEALVLLLAFFQLKLCACPVNPKLPEKALLSLINNLDINFVVARQFPLAKIPVLSIDDLVNFSAHSKPARPKIWYQGDDLCTMILSSGSTGQPKAIVHCYSNHLYSALASNQLLGLSPGHRSLLSLPLFHIGGLQIIFRCLLSGATMVLLNEPQDENALSKFRITHVSMVATQLQRLLNHDCPTEHLQVVLLGGGPVSRKLLATAAARNIPCYLSYGLTEMTSQVVTHDSDGNAHILQHGEMKLAPDGSILVKGLTLCSGYYQNRLHPLPLDQEGWFDTRDLGAWDQGRLSILGRKDNQFVSGGENIQPEEIEALCLQIAGIEQAVIIPLPDAEYGCCPVLFVNKDCETDIETIQSRLRAHLPSFKIPKRLFFIPETVSLKTSRLQLTQIAQKSLNQTP